MAEGRDDGGSGEDEEGDTRRGDEFREFWQECGKEGWKGRCKRVELDGRCEDPLPPLLLWLRGALLGVRGTGLMWGGAV